MSFKVGKHGIITGGFYLASPMYVTSIFGGLLEALTWVIVRKAEEGVGISRDGLVVKSNLNNGLASFGWVVLGSYDSIMSIAFLHSKESLVVGIGKKVGSSRVRMKDNKDKNTGKGSLWRTHGPGSSHGVMDVLLDLVFIKGIIFFAFSIFDSSARHRPSLWSLGGVRHF